MATRLPPVPAPHRPRRDVRRPTTMRTPASLAGLCRHGRGRRPAPRDPPPSFRAGTETVAIYATVLDAGGEMVRNLQRDDFDIFDDGRRQDRSRFSKRPAADHRHAAARHERQHDAEPRPRPHRRRAVRHPHAAWRPGPRRQLQRSCRSQWCLHRRSRRPAARPARACTSAIRPSCGTLWTRRSPRSGRSADAGS